MLEWKRFATPALSGQIESFERKTGIQLPPHYRSFLLSSNGGQPCEDVSFEVPDAGEVVMLGCLYSVVEDASGVDLETVYDELSDDLPRGFVPIGEDPGGNQLLLSIDGYNIEEIYFWDRVGFFFKRTGRNIFRVAKSIDALLEALRPMSED